MTGQLQSESISSLAPALVKAQQELTNIHKGRTAKVPTKSGGSYEYTYADLASVLDVVEPVLNKHGISVIQRSFPHERGAHIQTMLIHESGEWLADGGLFLPAPKNDPQGFGSAVTYNRRYGLAAMVGVAQTDDDAVSAVEAVTTEREQPATIPDESRARLVERMRALPEAERANVSEYLRGKSIAFQSLTEQQAKLVDAVLTQAENASSSESAA